MTTIIKRQVCRYKLVAQPLMTKESQRIKDSLETHDFLIKEVYDKDDINVIESFYAVFFDADNRVKGFIKVGEGGLNSVIVDPRVIFSSALKCLATAIIVTHNHPTGNTRPSEIDKKLTKQLVDGGKLLNIQVMDHIIVSERSYYSFRDHGMIN